MLGELDEQHVKLTATQLSIPVDFVRKDYYVTRAIHALTHVSDKYFRLVFQGGTSLSKGYSAISRMSEDVDFRVILTPAGTTLGKDARRKRLREFRHALVESLSQADLVVPKENVKVFYEGRFMSMRAEYAGCEDSYYLKPHVAIECFVGTLALEPKHSDITSLVKMTLGDASDHQPFPVLCIALDETAAEKWVALTRRISNSQLKQRKSDKQLVRHLYDLYQLHDKNLLTGEYIDIVHQIIEKDRVQFKNHNEDYAVNPYQASEKAIDALFTDNQWHDHWRLFIEQMVYEKNPPSFNLALDKLHMMSKNILKERSLL